LKFKADRNNLDGNVDAMVERHRRRPRLSSSNSLKAGMAMERWSAHILVLAFVATAACLPLAAQHDHPAPEKLGTVEFTTSGSPQAQAEFNRAVALLHSCRVQRVGDSLPRSADDRSGMWHGAFGEWP